MFFDSIKKRLMIVDNQKGSGIITTLVAMVFLISLGSSILMVSYTGYQMKVSQRYGNTSIARATTGMNMIKTAVEDMLYECYEPASLVASGASSSQSSDIFKNKYIEELKSKQVANGSNIFNIENDKIIQYNPDNLMSLVKETAKENNLPFDIITSLSSANVKQTDTYLIMYNIKVIGKMNGSISTITSDLKITYPTYQGQEQEPEPVEISCIAKDRIVSNNVAENTFKGGFYCNRLSLDSSGKFLIKKSEEKVSGANRYIIGNGIEIGGKPTSDYKLETESGIDIYTGGIKVHLESSAWFKGNEYVADDLDLFGNNSKVKIGNNKTGRYFGFGSYGGINSQSSNLANLSSSIVINGKNTQLDIGDAEKVDLRGVSFILGREELPVISVSKTKDLDTYIDYQNVWFSGRFIDNHINDKSNDDSDKIGDFFAYDLGEKYEYDSADANGALMGESISVKANQRIYLVPAEHLQYQYNGEDGKPTGKVFDHMESNPMKFDTPDGFAGITVSLKEDSVLWYDDNGEEKTYEDYGVSEVIALSEKWGQSSISHYYLGFKTSTADYVDYANKFFQDYLKYNTAEVDSYVDKYLSMVGKINFENVKLAGNAYVPYEDANGKIQHELITPVPSSSQSILTNVTGFINTYNTGKQFLTSDVKNYLYNNNLAIKDNPFDNIISSTYLDKLGYVTDIDVKKYFEVLGYELDESGNHKKLTDTVNVKYIEQSGKVTKAEIYNNEGKLVGIIAIGDITIDEKVSEKLSLIVSSGVVTLKNRTYSGLIICDDLIMSGEVTIQSNPNAVIETCEILESQNLYSKIFRIPLYTETTKAELNSEAGSKLCEWDSWLYD